MVINVTLGLPNRTFEYAQQVSQATHRSLDDVLSDFLETFWPIMDDVPVRIVFEDVSLLSDKDVLALANLKMNRKQSDRYEDLIAKSKNDELSQAEQLELLSLMQISRLGLLRKAQGLSEAVRRGLREPLHS